MIAMLRWSETALDKNSWNKRGPSTVSGRLDLCHRLASKDGGCLVGALCEGRAIQRQSIWCAGLTGLARASNQTNQKNQTGEMS